GIGKGSIYLHFSSKEEIALSHIDRIIEHLITKLRKIAGKSDPVNNRLHEMLVERVLYRFDSVQHYSKSLNELLTYIRPSLLEHRRKHFDDEARVFATVITEGQANDEIIAGDPLDLAKTLVFATNSLLPYNLSTHEIEDRGVVKERTKKTADLLIRGLSK
ncbi:MAG: TetR/AcrR family transcriptional regulator, partial [Acidobacteriota bacterium]